MFDGGFCFAINATHGDLDHVYSRCHFGMGGVDAVDMYAVCPDGQAVAVAAPAAPAAMAPTSPPNTVCQCSTPRLCTNNGCGCATGCADGALFGWMPPPMLRNPGCFVPILCQFCANFVLLFVLMLANDVVLQVPPAERHVSKHRRVSCKRVGCLESDSRSPNLVSFSCTARELSVPMLLTTL